MVEQEHGARCVKHNIIGSGYFATMGIPLLAGRTFGPQDTVSSQKVIVSSDTMARTMFPSGSLIGHRYGVGGPERANDLEVIGVVKDVKFWQPAGRSTDIGLIPRHTADTVSK